MSKSEYYKSQVLPRTLGGKIHFGITILFFIGVFGPYFDLWANTSKPVIGIPAVFIWVFFCLAVQTINMVIAYYTIMRPWGRGYEALYMNDRSSTKPARDG